MTCVKYLLMLTVAALPWLPAFAQPVADDCARARDPERCEARQAALKACGEKRGKEKTACLEAAMPPVDCSRSENPGKCEATQNAREACKGKTGKALKQCMRDEKPKKKPRPIRPAA
jgi:hypothetical protein